MTELSNQNSNNSKINSDYCIFNNYIYNNLNFYLNKENLNEDEKKFLFNNINSAEFSLSDEGKNLVCDYLDMILDDDYVLKKDEDCRKARFYFLKLFILIFFRWSNGNLGEIYNQITDFNKLINKFNIQYYQGQHFLDLSSKITCFIAD